MDQLHEQNRMLDEPLGINPATVVVLKDSNPVLMPWIAKAPAVLEVWNQDSEDGHVVADLLFGVQTRPESCRRRIPDRSATRCTRAERSAIRAPTRARATR
jgi:hypothetical protein